MGGDGSKEGKKGEGTTKGRRTSGKPTSKKKLNTNLPAAGGREVPRGKGKKVSIFGREGGVGNGVTARGKGSLKKKI